MGHMCNLPHTHYGMAIPYMYGEKVCLIHVCESHMRIGDPYIYGTPKVPNKHSSGKLLSSIDTLIESQ